MMSKKDYQRAAKLIQLNKEAGAPYMNETECLIDVFADFFKGDNPNFDRGRFEAAARAPLTTKVGRSR